VWKQRRAVSLAYPQGTLRNLARQRDGQDQLRLHRRELRSADGVDLLAGQVLFRLSLSQDIDQNIDHFIK
jgi:hypothetical protein